MKCATLKSPIPIAIVLTEPDGRVRTHYVKGSNDAHRLWLALEQQLRLTGWTGPVGQELTPGRRAPGSRLQGPGAGESFRLRTRSPY